MLICPRTYFSRSLFSNLESAFSLCANFTQYRSRFQIRHQTVAPVSYGDVQVQRSVFHAARPYARPQRGFHFSRPELRSELRLRHAFPPGRVVSAEHAGLFGSHHCEWQVRAIGQELYLPRLLKWVSLTCTTCCRGCVQRNYLLPLQVEYQRWLLLTSSRGDRVS